MSFHEVVPRHRIGADPEVDQLSDRIKMGIGLAAIAIGLITAVVGSWLVHATEAAKVSELGVELYPWIPRGWYWTTAAQFIALNGVILAMAGATVAFLYDRPLTWARAALGAGLFAGLMIIVFGVIPNQMLTLAQGPLELTSARVIITVPPALVLGNELTLTAETVKDMVVGGYAFTNLIVIAVIMVLWQNYQARKDDPKPQRISEYGRPIRVDH
jgi:hypothetical protein